MWVWLWLLVVGVAGSQHVANGYQVLKAVASSWIFQSYGAGCSCRNGLQSLARWAGWQSMLACPKLCIPAWWVIGRKQQHASRRMAAEHQSESKAPGNSPWSRPCSFINRGAGCCAKLWFWPMPEWELCGSVLLSTIIVGKVQSSTKNTAATATKRYL